MDVELNTALRRLADYDSPERRKDFYRALLDATLIMAVGTDVQQGETQEFALLEDEAGKISIPAFTDELAIQNFLRPGLGTLEVASVVLFQMALVNQATAVVLNPGSDVSLRLTQGEIQQLADGKVPDTGNVGILTHVGAARVASEAEWPPRLAEHVRTALRGIPSVERGFLFRMAPPEDEERAFLGVCFNATATPSELATAMSQLAERIIAPPGGLELIVLAGELLGRVERVEVPVFSRQPQQLH